MAILTEIEVMGLLTPQVRAALADTLGLTGGAVLVVLSSEGLPPDELGDPGAAAEIAALCATLAARERSCVALTGAVRGAALELALAAALRVADDSAVLCCPDITFGLVPGAGGTQRLPRLVGGAVALGMLLGAADVPGAVALATGLVDRVEKGDARPAARALVQGGALPERSGLRDGRGYLAAVAQARAAGSVAGQSAGGAEAADRMIDCVEMALLLPLEQGLAYERVCYDDLARSERSLGLRHAAAVFARTDGGEGQAVARVGIWGGGPVAADLVLNALGAGLVVQIAADRRETVVGLLADVAERQEALVQAGSLAPDRREDDWARLMPQVGTRGLDGVELSILTEAVPLAGPCLAIGFPPLEGMIGLSRFDRLAEVQPGDVAAGDVSRAVGFARAMGWEPVVTGRGGSVALRLAAALSDAVVQAEARGVARSAIAQSLAAQGIAGEGGVQGAAPDETALRCLAALANAGAKAIAAGEAVEAAQVDAVAIAAGLMARWTGGPMHQANRRGLLVLRRDLRLWEAEDGALWSPAPLIDALVSEGRGFS